jgi:hypothetical protein
VAVGVYLGCSVEYQQGLIRRRVLSDACSPKVYTEVSLFQLRNDPSMLLHSGRHVSVYSVTLFGPTSVEDDGNFLFSMQTENNFFEAV